MLLCSGVSVCLHIKNNTKMSGRHWEGILFAQCRFYERIPWNAAVFIHYCKLIMIMNKDQRGVFVVEKKLSC